MSMFESVWIKLACQRCGKVEKTIVRFHSYNGPPDAEYELMEVVPQGVGLSRGEVWEGNADRYCEQCYFDWSIAQANAAYEALAELIENGVVTARAKGSSPPASDSLPVSAINEYKEKYVRKLRREKATVVTMPFFDELRLTVENKPVEDLDRPITDQSFDGYPVWDEFLLLIDPLLSDRMSKAGWVADGSTSEDFHVSLDDGRRIVVTDMQGRKLTRDGGRAAQ